MKKLIFHYRMNSNEESSFLIDEKNQRLISMNGCGSTISFSLLKNDILSLIERMIDGTYDQYISKKIIVKNSFLNEDLKFYAANSTCFFLKAFISCLLGINTFKNDKLVIESILKRKYQLD